MARNTSSYTATSGRDKGKKFKLTEMSAFDIEDWSIRALFVLMKSNPSLDEEFLSMGAAAMVQMGFKALQLVDPASVKPLLDEMIKCVEICPDKSKPGFTREINRDADDVEEVETIKDLRVEWWTLHMGFLQRAVPSLVSRVKGMVQSEQPRSSTTRQPRS